MEELQQIHIEIKSLKQIKKELLPKCPKCGAEHLHLFEKGLGCTKECGFVIWKTVASKTLSENHLCEIAEKGKSPLIKGFTSKSNTKFDAYLVLDKKDWKVKFEFENKKQ